MGLYRSPLSLSDALEFLASIERSIREHNLEISVDLKILAENEYVLYLSPEGYYLWGLADWKRYVTQRKLLYARKPKDDRRTSIQE